jgi:hypothetical protein
MEYLTLTPAVGGFIAYGVLIEAEEGQGYRLDYTVICDSENRVHKVHMTVDGGASLQLLSDGRGQWTDGAGAPLPALTGCIDIDISATPFTNMLPIRYFRWQVGQSETFQMVYVRVPSLALSVENQRYTCLQQYPDGALFRFENLDGGFTADLPVDRDGLVLDYPGLFTRLWPKQ